MLTPTRNLKGNVTRLAVAFVAVGTLTGLSIGAADAATVTPPSVSTGAVSNVTPSTAVLNGSVDPHGASTSWHVEYGTTTAYGSKTSAAAITGGNQAVSIKVGGLKPETTYHYAFVAANAGGTVTGGDGILSTLGAPVATTGVVNELSATSLRFTGVVQPNGQTTHYFFEYGTTPTYGSRTTTASAGASSQSVAVEYLVSNLKPSTEYYYRLVAYTPGATTYGLAENATTASDITLSASAVTITYGATDVISGVTADHLSGETVGILAEPAGQTAFAGIGTTTTAANGAWSYTVKPMLLTQYEVGVAGGNSPAIAVSVRPAVKLSSTAAANFTTRISAGVPFAGHVAQVQRLVNNTWTLVRHFALGAGGKATIPSSWLPKGNSDVRVAIGVDVTGPNQAGQGYLAGISNSISFKR